MGIRDASGEPHPPTLAKSGEPHPPAAAKEADVFHALTELKVTVSEAARRLKMPESTARRLKNRLLKKGAIKKADELAGPGDKILYVEAATALRYKRDYSRSGLWRTTPVSPSPHTMGDTPLDPIRVHDGRCVFEVAGIPKHANVRREWVIARPTERRPALVGAVYDLKDENEQPISITVQPWKNGVASTVSIFIGERWVDSQQELNEVVDGFQERCRSLVAAWLELVGFQGSWRLKRCMRPDYAVPAAVPKITGNWPRKKERPDQLAFVDDSVPGGEVESTCPTMAVVFASDNPDEVLRGAVADIAGKVAKDQSTHLEQLLEGMRSDTDGRFNQVIEAIELLAAHKQ